MKRIKGFTLLEMLIVMAIIGMLYISLKNFVRDKGDIGKDAVNIIYKEMNQYIKEFQRNKIREDASGIEHRIEYLQISFGDETGITGNNLYIGNIFIYKSGDSNTGHMEGTALISGQKYSAFQYLKGSNNYNFYTRVKDTGDVTPILISNNGKIYSGNINTINYESGEVQTGLLTGIIYEFLICGGKEESSSFTGIGKISINAVTKNTKLERCETEKYAGIDCSEFALCY